MKQKSGTEIGMVGLGRMGANMVRRLLKGRHRCVVYDRAPQAVKELSAPTPWLISRKNSPNRARCG